MTGGNSAVVKIPKCEFEVLDSRGRKAAWLERKITAAIQSDIETEIAEALTSTSDDYDY